MSKFFYSYTDFIKDRINFKRVDTTGPNRFDNPAALYYKIVFYFSDENGLLGINNVTVNNTDKSVKAAVNITAPFTGGEEGPSSAKNNLFSNTAYNYLLLNDEIERAEYLKRFLILLSDISADSPWYFQEIGGLDAALERKVFSEGELKIEDKPRQITIKCLNDSYDNRIGTLLDLYRAACFSYQNKKEIVPANLRKFNMGILVFNAPIRGKGGKSGDPNNMILIPDSKATFYIPSCKLIELRNCEFDYNSAKSAFGTLNTTQDAFEPQYTITINFDDCYESRYNEIAQMVVTDFINIDIRKERIGGFYDDIDVFGVNPFGDENGELKYKDDSKEFWTDKIIQTGISNDGIDQIYKTHIIPDNIKNDNNTTREMLLKEILRQAAVQRKLGNVYENKNKNSLKGILGEPLTSATDAAIDMGNLYKDENSLNGILGGSLGYVKDAVNQTKKIVQTLSNPKNIIENTRKNLIYLGKSELKKQVDKLYIGNIGGKSIRDVLSQTNGVSSGDITPVVGFIKDNQNGQSNSTTLPGYSKSSTSSSEKIDNEQPKGVLPDHLGWQKQRTDFLAKMNKAKSLRNNL